jgi:hypothetical protein
MSRGVHNIAFSVSPDSFCYYTWIQVLTYYNNTLYYVIEALSFFWNLSPDFLKQRKPSFHLTTTLRGLASNLQNAIRVFNLEVLEGPLYIIKGKDHMLVIIEDWSKG